MMDIPQQSRHETVEQFLGSMLRVGVIASALVVLVGAVIYLSKHGGEAFAPELFARDAAEFRSIPSVLVGIGEMRGRGVIQLGLLLLIATPVLRVAFSLIAFIGQRDWLYFSLTTAVLLLLVFSLLFVDPP